MFVYSGSLPRLCKVIPKRANEWSVVDCDPRTQDPKVTVGSALCKYYQKGRCKFANECKFHYVSSGNEKPEEQERKGRRQSHAEGCHNTARNVIITVILISKAAQLQQKKSQLFHSQFPVHRAAHSMLREWRCQVGAATWASYGSPLSSGRWLRGPSQSLGRHKRRAQRRTQCQRLNDGPAWQTADQVRKVSIQFQRALQQASSRGFKTVTSRTSPLDPSASVRLKRNTMSDSRCG